jgi:DNA-directed RNA polymerase sigma subunit (sigma70/sigma32)
MFIVTSMDSLKLSDSELASLIKKQEDDQALNILIERHSGIYVDMIGRYGSKSLSENEIHDLINERDLVIYKAALDYDENRAKFCTHVGNKAKYLCLSKKTENKKKGQTISFESIDYSEESSEMLPSEKCEINENFSRIMKMINDHSDDRVQVIFKERYFGGEGGKLKTWKKISQKIGISTPGCINIHDRTIKEFQKQIRNNA